MKTQLDIEHENLQVMITKGMNELETAKNTGMVSDLKSSGAVMPYYIGDLANALKVYSDCILMGRAKIKALPAKMLTLLDPRVVAHYTVKAVIDSAGSKHVSIVSIGRKLAGYLETEYKVQQLDEEKKDSFVNFIQSTNYVGDRQFKITNDLLKKFHKDVIKAELSFYKLASKAIVLLSGTKPIVKNQIMPPLCYITEKKGIETRVEVASWFKDWLIEMVSKDDGMILPEYHTPLIEEPIKWTKFYGGGFHSPRFKYPLIKTEVDREEFKNIPERTIAAVNRLQGTKWKVNQKVLEVMLAASENDLGWGDLPTTYNAKDYLTPCPHADTEKEFLSEEQKADRKLWREQSAPHYAEQESRQSKVLAVKRVLLEAKRFKRYSDIYFSYFLDFRGRIYPKASNLHPQGTDYVKSLLEFSEGKSLDTSEARSYFYMQGANSFGHGLDKKTLVEKNGWIVNNHFEILKCAENPYALDGLWHKADEDPWLFLAFCFEYAEYKKDPWFKSKLPIAFDGSCNGLQHLSAILLDEVGGEAVNLTAKPVKQDIYDTVRVKTVELLEADSEPLAKELLKFGITRKACKKPVMIVPYAGTPRACRKYIGEQMIKEGALKFFGDNYKEALTLYTSTVWEAIGCVILKGKEIMSFLSLAAKTKISQDMDTTIRWITPNGFEVKQKRTKNRCVAIKTPLGNTIKSKGYIQNLVATNTDETAVNKHATAIAPNLVHSLDACHLQETVLSMPEDTSFAMIHDSFGCHAADAKVLSEHIRLVFYNMYSKGDVLDKFLEQQELTGLDDVPTTGKLDLMLVLKDEFFFS